MKQEKVFYENEKQRISAALHTPDASTEKCIILVHGFTGDKDTEGSSDIYPRLADALAKKGFACLRFDCRGSGESDGRFEDMTIAGETSDLRVSIGYVKHRGFNKIGVLGSSHGGCITLLGYENNIDCLVLWYPVIFPKETQGFEFMKENEAKLNRDGKIFYKERNGKKFHIGKQMYIDRKNAEPFSKIKDIRCAILIVTGDKDSRVDKSQSERAFAAAKEPKSLEIIHGADHCFRNPDDTPNQDYMNKAIDMTVRFFVNHLK